MKLERKTLSAGNNLMILLFLVYSCQNNQAILSKNNIGSSKSIEESIENGFYVKSIALDTNIVEIDTLGELKIKEIFIEKKWRSKSDFSKVALNSWHLVVVTSNKLPDDYGFKWKIVAHEDQVFWQYGDNILVSTLYEIDLKKEKFELTMYIGDVFYLDTSKYDFKVQKFYLGEG